MRALSQARKDRMLNRIENAHAFTGSGEPGTRTALLDNHDNDHYREADVAFFCVTPH